MQRRTADPLHSVPDSDILAFFRDAFLSCMHDPRIAAVSPSVTIRMLGPGDPAVLEHVAPGVFDNAIEPRWAAEFLTDPRHHMAVALLRGEVIGMASAVHYLHPDKPTELWINELGVAPGHQSQGIGKRLIQALFARGRALGCTEAWLGTEETNQAARRLYATVGGKEALMVYVTFDLGAGIP